MHLPRHLHQQELLLRRLCEWRTSLHLPRLLRRLFEGMVSSQLIYLTHC